MTIPTLEPAQSIPLRLIAPAASNPRQHMDPARLEELANSIRLQGVLQPILVRPRLSDDDDTPPYECVFGHRRIKACELAELDEIPAHIVSMSEEQADLARLHENRDREDVHYVEEAEALARLGATYGYSTQQLMREFGQQATWVLSRMKIAKLHPVVREQCLANVIGAEVATLIARVPHPLQPKAMDRCLVTDHSSDVPAKRCQSFRFCRDELRRGFTVPITSAPFDTFDATLPRTMGGHGGCHTCQSMSDNDSALADLGRGLCCNPDCYNERARMAREAKLAQLREEGRLREGEAAADLLRSRDHVSLDDRVEGPGGTVMTVRELIQHAGEHKPEASPPNQVQAAVQPGRDPATAPIIERVPRDVVAHLQEAFGVKPAAPPDKDAEAEAERQAEEARLSAMPLEHRAVLEGDCWSLVRAAVRARLPHSEITAEDLRYWAFNYVEYTNTHRDTEALLGWPDDLAYGDDERRRVLLIDATPAQLAQMVVSEALADDAACSFLAHDAGQAYKAHVLRIRLAIAARHGVDVVAAAGLSAAQGSLLEGLPSPGSLTSVQGTGGDSAEAQTEGVGEKRVSATTTQRGRGKPAKGQQTQAASGLEEVTDEAACGGAEQMDDDADAVGVGSRGVAEHE